MIAIRASAFDHIVSSYFVYLVSSDQLAKFVEQMLSNSMSRISCGFFRNILLSLVVGRRLLS